MIRQLAGKGKRLQYIRGMSVVNKTYFGSMIRGTLKTEEVFSLVCERGGCGWLDGGCVTLASAFICWLKSDAEAWCVHMDGFPQHVVVRIFRRDLYLDGDGIGTEEDLLIKMVKSEGLKGRLSLQPFDLSDLPSDFTLWPDIALDVAEVLYRRIGPGCDIKHLLPVDIS